MQAFYTFSVTCQKKAQSVCRTKFGVSVIEQRRVFTKIPSKGIP
ncbi:hypothetical protein [Sulfurospirillum cavolei]|nr:hypothetical protein [Sulfurospirillum cavolei]